MFVRDGKLIDQAYGLNDAYRQVQRCSKAYSEPSALIFCVLSSTHNADELSYKRGMQALNIASKFHHPEKRHNALIL
jgi:hypothetical protein